MERIVLACHGVPPAAGAEAAADITAEFRDHRQWQKNVVCSWDGARLILQADTECDPKGLALTDEFSDCICAYISGGFDGEITVQSVTSLPDAAA